MSAFVKTATCKAQTKKSKVFTLEEMERFLDNASDDEYLLQKVIFIVGVFGGCRIGEFIIISGSNSVPAIDVFRKYRILRSETISHKRFSINYKNTKNARYNL